jgi:glycosyltransferase involved in cell wall biosynthesis
MPPDMRVAMFVYNDCRSDARVLREAATLRDAGHRVTIIGRPTDPQAVEGDSEERDGIAIVRIPVPGAWRASWTALLYPWRTRGRRRWLLLPWAAVRAPFYLVARARRRRRPGGSTADWLALWRFGILGWAGDAAAIVPHADVYHGHDLHGLAAADMAARARGGSVIHDAHEIFLESGSNAPRPRWAKVLLARLERRASHRAAALVTVNSALADELERRLRPRRIVVVHNCPPRWVPPAIPADRLRLAAGIAADTPVVLYHGGFSAHRGMEELATALLEPGMAEVHAVYLGYGSRRAELERSTADPRFGGRLHVLDAVPPDVLLEWVTGADVSVMAIQNSTLNHYLSSPNKLFESLAAGVPVVVSDFPVMRRIVLEDPDGPLGATCDPSDPASIAIAVRSILERTSQDRAALRARCLRAAHERWNWETEEQVLLALYATLPALSEAGGTAA